MRVGVFSALPAAMLLLACGGGGGAPDAAPRVEAVVLGPEDVARAAREQIAAGPRLSGSLEPKRQATLRAEAAGQVEEVAAELGQSVEEGDVLARIERGNAGDAVVSAQAELSAAQHALDLALRDRSRTQHLVEAGALPRREREATESAVAAAQARVNEARAHLSTAREQLSDTTIRAPFDGVVSERGVNEGDVIAQGAVLFTILDPSSMRLEGSVTADELSDVREGADVTFSVRGYADETFEGHVAWVAPAADAQTRQIPVLVEIPNESGRLVARLFAEGRVSAETREALVVPAAAVDESGTNPQVARVRDGQVERVSVELGTREEPTEQVEILEGLSPGDVVLVHGARDIVPGTPVTLPNEAS